MCLRIMFQFEEITEQQNTGRRQVHCKKGSLCPGFREKLLWGHSKAYINGCFMEILTAMRHWKMRKSNGRRCIQGMAACPKRQVGRNKARMYAE